MSVRLLAVGVLVLASPLAAAQQIYKWVDSSGHVTYSATPPPGAAAHVVDLPPAPPPDAIEAARQRERSLQELGDQLSQDRQERSAQLAQERQAASAAVAPPPVQPPQDTGIRADAGWWLPANPPRPPGIRPSFPLLVPVRPPPGRDPTAPPDHPVFWPRKPVLPPENWPSPPPRPLPRPLPAEAPR